MSKIIKFTTIKKTDFEVWVDEPLTDTLWEQIASKYVKEVEHSIDYLTETLIDDYNNKTGMFEEEEPKDIAEDIEYAWWHAIK